VRSGGDKGSQRRGRVSRLEATGVDKEDKGDKEDKEDKGNIRNLKVSVNISLVKVFVIDNNS